MALMRVNPFAVKHAANGVKVGGLRWQIFNEHDNGLAESGAIVRNGRTVWIDEDRYFDWLRSGGKLGAA